jgi:predicted membrane protein
MSLLSYLFYLLSFLFAVIFIVCIAMQQMITYHKIIEKARKFTKNKYDSKNSLL